MNKGTLQSGFKLMTDKACKELEAGLLCYIYIGTEPELITIRDDQIITLP
ncbi:MAG: hypothetical protein IKO47_06045 [Ruminococcus sp.]|nr:hypothetical protein [Ruminococcus sp.]